jgi:hypothetical protein
MNDCSVPCLGEEMTEFDWRSKGPAEGGDSKGDICI